MGPQSTMQQTWIEVPDSSGRPTLQAVWIDATVAAASVTAA